MKHPAEHHLSRRERQIMDIIYALGKASAKQVHEGMSDPPTRTAVRTMLRILEEKGQLKHTKKGREFIYQPVRARASAGRSALKRVLSTFFDDSLTRAMAVHLSDSKSALTDEEIDQLAALIRQAKKKGV